jgi:antitoxin HigA-1
MTMKNPPHPGEIIRDLCIKPIGLTVAEAAKRLGVTRKTLSLLLNGCAGISPKMAIRLSQAFGRSPESWLQPQARYDLAQLRKAPRKIQFSAVGGDTQGAHFQTSYPNDVLGAGRVRRYVF